MSETEVFQELRRIVAIVAGQYLAAERATGTIAQAKKQVRADLVAMVREKFADYIEDAARLAGAETHRSTDGPATTSMEQAQRDLDWILLHPLESDKQALQKTLAVLLGINIIRVLRFLGDQPSCCLYTEQADVTIGTGDRIYSQTKFREVVGAATNGFIPKVSGAVWEKCIQAILLLCEDVSVGDPSHPAQQTRAETRSWLHDYLVDRGVRGEEDYKAAVEACQPFVKDGCVHLSTLDDFIDWLDVNRGQHIDPQTLGRRMRLAMPEIERQKVNFYVGYVGRAGRRTTRSCWRLPGISSLRQQEGEDEGETRLWRWWAEPTGGAGDGPGGLPGEQRGHHLRAGEAAGLRPGDRLPEHRPRR